MENKKTKMSNKDENRIKKQRKQDILTIRILVTILVVIAFILLLGQVSKMYNGGDLRDVPVIHNFLLSFRWIALMLAAVFLAAGLVLRPKSSTAFSLSFHTGGIFLLSFVAAWYISYQLGNPIVITALFIMLPVAALLYLFYHIFHAEFFYLALFCSVSALGLWLLYRLMINVNRSVSVGIAVGVFAGIDALCAVILFCFYKKEGFLQFGKKKIRVFPVNCRYKLFFAASALLIVILALALIFGAAIAWYGVMAMLIYVFIMAVYYTVRLM